VAIHIDHNFASHHGNGVEDGVAKLPARKQVAEWIIGAYKSITKQTARNA
jgi:hypothetical protein